MDMGEGLLNVPLEPTDGTEPPPPETQTEQVNAVFTGSGKSNDSPKIQKDQPPHIIVNNKIEKDRPFKTTKGTIPYPQRLKVDHSHINRIVKEY
ncbi:hypothetical protein Tco_0308297 [Tanacetum coccineum]